MTSKQWREVSEAFDTPPGERTERQHDITEIGLCGAIAAVSPRLCKHGKFLDAIMDFCNKGAHDAMLAHPHTRRGEVCLRAIRLCEQFAMENMGEGAERMPKPDRQTSTQKREKPGLANRPLAL